MVKKEKSNEEDRKMLPSELATEKKVNYVIVAGAFAGNMKELITEIEFEQKTEEFLTRKSEV